VPVSAAHASRRRAAPLRAPALPPTLNRSASSICRAPPSRRARRAARDVGLAWPSAFPWDLATVPRRLDAAGRLDL